MEEGVGPFLSSRMTQHDYRIVSVVNGSFVPREGDRVTVTWLQVRSGRLVEAETIYRERIEPALRADASLRAAYLLEEPGANVLVGIGLPRSNAVADPKVAGAWRLLQPLLEKPAREAVNTIYHFHDE